MRETPTDNPFSVESDATLEALIRAACEVDALESGVAPRIRHHSIHVEHGVSRAAAGRPLKLRRTAIAAGLAMAACLIWQVAIPSPDLGNLGDVETAPSVAGVGLRGALPGLQPLDIEFAADAAPRDDRCVARFTGTANEGGALVALFRAWDRHCGCRTWRLYRWEDGNAITQVRRDESLRFALDVSDMPPTEQLLVVAVASNSETLPGDAGEAEELLACLNSSPLEMQSPEDLAEFASAVETCLPGAAIVAHPFTTE